MKTLTALFAALFALSTAPVAMAEEAPMDSVPAAVEVTPDSAGDFQSVQESAKKKKKKKSKKKAAKNKKGKKKKKKSSYSDY
jgi:hypothetical protein